MRGIAKQLSLLTAIVLLVSVLVTTASAAPLEDCPGGCTHAAAIGTTHYDTLEEAVTAAKKGNTVTLLTDITLDSTLVFSKSMVLNLGNKCLTGSIAFTNGGTVKNGKILAVAEPAVQVSGCTVAIEKDAVLAGCGTVPTLSVTAAKGSDALVNISGTLTGDGEAPVVDVTAAAGKCQLNILKEAKLTAKENTVISFDSAGKLEISGGTIQGEKDLIALQIKKDRKTEVAITGGKLLSKEGDALVITAEKDASVPQDFVTGGTYHKVPTDYVPAYCKIRDNGDKTYTVISSYILTFQSGGASGTMDAVKIQCGSAYTLPKPGFTAASGKDFAGWEIGGKTYAAGESFTPGNDTTITATWKDHVHTGGKATCLSKAECSSCGKSYGKLASHNLSHSGGYAPTCDSTGMSAHSKCSVCGSLFADGVAVSVSDLSTAALGHNWESQEGKDATCTEDGMHPHRTCTVCGEIQINGVPAKEEALVIPAAGHTLENVAATASECTVPGIQAHEHCTVCDELFLNDQVVEISDLTTALASHVLKENWESDATYHWKACVSCSEVFRQNRHADADADGSCDDCGYAMPVQEVPASETTSGFSWLYLIPVIAAVAVAAIPLILQKRKNA